MPPLVRSALVLTFAALHIGLGAGTNPQSPEVFTATSELDVRSFGALGDGTRLDTAAINAAIEKCSSQGGGLVTIPAGQYRSGTIHLRSGVTLRLDAGARLIGSTNLNDYSRPSPPPSMPEARWGNWHRGLIVGEEVHDVSILGPGTIDGAKVFDPGGEEHMRGPHTIVLSQCHDLVFRDFSLVDSANYAVFAMVSDNLEFRNLKITGGWDGIHWRGAPNRWCHNVDIIDCQFATGDDAIAGRYWDDTLITRCFINSSCNGIRLIGPARNLNIHDNFFLGPGRQPHRTSREQRRTNMLSGIILQPGAWDATEGPLDDVLISQNTMKNVASPITLWSKPGNTVGRILIEDLKASGVYRSALSVESWMPQPIGEVVLRRADLEFSGGGTAESAERPAGPPGVDARAVPAWGVYARNVDLLTLEDVRLTLLQDDLRPAIHAESVDTLRLDQVRLPENPQVDSLVRTQKVTHLILHITQPSIGPIRSNR